MRIIVAGAGEIGSHLAKMLSMEYHEITVISPDPESLEELASDSDIVTVEGHPTSIETLVQAGAGSADLFIAVNPDSEQDINIVSAALAKKLGAKKVTARINNEEYQKNDNRIIFTDLGIDSLFYPEKIAATEIVNLLKQNNASEFMNYSHGKLQLIVYRLEECSPMVDRTVAELRERTQNLFRSVAISRDGKTIIPKSATRFKLGDVVYLVSKKEGMEQALSLSGKPKVSVRNLMILGGGRIGEMVARSMEKQAENIKLIELRPDRCAHLSEALDRTLVINGDGRNSDLLMQEGLKDHGHTQSHSRGGELRVYKAGRGDGCGLRHQQETHHRRQDIPLHSFQQGPLDQGPQRNRRSGPRIHSKYQQQDNHRQAQGAELPRGGHHRRLCQGQRELHRRQREHHPAIRSGRGVRQP